LPRLVAAVTATVVVIVTVLIVAAYIGVVDRVLNVAVGLVFK